MQRPTRTPALAPYLVVSDARGLIAFLEKTVHGELSYEVMDGNRLMHAEVRIGDSLVMVGESPDRTNFPAMLHIYVKDCDAVVKRSGEAGARIVRDPRTGPDGDRRGGVEDKWGNQWWFSTPQAA